MESTSAPPQKVEEEEKNQITDVFLCIVGLPTHSNEKDMIKLFKKCTPADVTMPLKGVAKKRGGNFGFLQFSDRDQLKAF